MMCRCLNRTLVQTVVALGITASTPVFSEVMLQYFNTSWSEIERKLPELAEAGYTSMWLPPPAKGGGALSVGYDHFDPFDLGDLSQRDTVSTRYGTKAQLLHLVRKAHQFGIRIYFDNIMNHRGFDVPGYNEDTDIDIYPGLYPEDFHLRITEDGFYRKWDNVRNWSDEWQVLHLCTSDLIDLAHEDPNGNHGDSEGDTMPKLSLVRQPDNPEYYPDTDLPVIYSYVYNSVTYNFYPFANKEPYSDTGYTNSSSVVDGSGNGTFDWEDLDDDGQHDANETNHEYFVDTGIDPLNNTSTDYGYGDGIYNMGDPIEEDVNSYLIRAVRWQMNQTRCDGFRLDAVKHVPYYFFGTTDADTPLGYTGGIQLEYNHIHGFGDLFNVDPNNRNSAYNTEAVRDDAVIFGEHLGEPPSYSGYISAGMRLVDNVLKSNLDGNLGNPWASLAGYDAAGGGSSFNQYQAVQHSQSHDNSYSTMRELQHAFYLARSGLPLIYTDGYNESQTCEDCGGEFPRHANCNFLGQFADPKIPTLVHMHNQYARGIDQWGRWSDADMVAFERHDDREGSTEADRVVLLFAMNDNTVSDIAFNDNLGSAFPSGKIRPPGAGSDQGLVVQFPPGSVLRLITDDVPHSEEAYPEVTVRNATTDYGTASGDPNNYVYVGSQSIPSGAGAIEIVVPRESYVAYSYMGPEESDVRNGDVIEFREDGTPVDSVTVTRTDGVDGDPSFNPYGVSDSDTADYSYDIDIPRVTQADGVDVYAFVDGSAEDILMKLDGGLDLNSQMGIGSSDSSEGYRDIEPGDSDAYDVYLGYESTHYVGRYGAEKFASTDTASNTLTSAGAGTYGYYVNGGSNYYVSGFGNNDFDGASYFTADWIYHDDGDSVSVTNASSYGSPTQQRVPEFPNDGESADVWIKIGYEFDVDTVYVYYTTDNSDPEGAYGVGFDHTEAVTASFVDSDSVDGTIDWWRATIPAQTNVLVKYKVGAYSTSRAELAGSLSDADGDKTHATTIRSVTNLNFGTMSEWWNKKLVSTNGLEDGYHCLWARAFLNRAGKAAIYNTFVQPFYLDAYAPTGLIVYPSNDGDYLSSSTYGAVIRADETVTRVLFHVSDNTTNNDDAVTGESNGNGLDTNGVPSWVDATSVTPYQPFTETYPDLISEYRFDLRRIPAYDGNSATVQVALYEASSEIDTNRITYLTRVFYPNAPDKDIYVRYPEDNSTVTMDVNDSYNIRIYFSEGLSWTATNFTLTINGSVKSSSSFSFEADADSGYDQLVYEWSDFRDGENYIEINYVDADYNLYNSCLVTMQVVGVTVSIVTPPEADENGDPYVIILQDTNPVPDYTYTVEVETGTSASNVWITFPYSTNYFGGICSGPTTNGGDLHWTWEWSNLVEGSYYLIANVDSDGDTNTVEASADRSTSIEFWQYVTANTNDFDDDDDGLFDTNETTSAELPSSNSETWNNGDVHVYYAYGHSDPLTPDTDNDGLPDALEVGWGSPSDTSQTDTNADLNADGYPNFIGDTDPPYFNTYDNSGLDNFNSDYSRTDQIYGSTTDPGDSDTDNDGIEDGVEDWNRNGWVDGDGTPGDADENNWPDDTMDSGETWTETDPNNSDSDGDGTSDGSEDADHDGWISGDVNSNRVFETGETWTETDPLNDDTDGDGLPDGWERNYSLSALDDGTNDMSDATSSTDGDADNGAGGNPDSDTVIIGTNTVDYTNLLEYQNGTNPRHADDIESSDPANLITIGQGDALGTANGVTYYEEFTDWSADDCRVLDEYEGGGSLSDQSDVYPGYDGYDTSRDMVAFYSKDGGATNNAYYFRIDFYDLQAYAEEGYLDMYVIIDTGNPNAGEMKLPDEVDTLTSNKWELVVAVYESGLGTVYVDENSGANSTSESDDLSSMGVVSHNEYFEGAYFNSELDSVEFAISRDALAAVGWVGLPLNFQVFTTKDGTCNSCSSGSPGSGDIGGRNDIRDSFYNDYISEDESEQPDTMYYYFSSSARASRAQYSVLLHGNQAVQPGNVIQDYINTGAGAGYYRPLDIHEVYAAPLNLHITPTLASAIEWARVDTNESATWRDGPTFNDRIASLIATNVVDLLASTFSDHMMPYFTYSYNQDNVELANEFLQAIYGVDLSDTNTVFWTPERLLDADVFSKIQSLGYQWTVIDQMVHLYDWQGRTTALGDGGYKVNEINDVKCFIINDSADDDMFENYDGGLSMTTRRLLIRKAQDSTQDQTILFFSNWEEFADNDSADAYDVTIRWLANHPWIEIVTLQQIADGEIDWTGDGVGEAFGTEDRGTASLEKKSHRWMDHATEQDFDNWYVGSSQEQGLETNVFQIRSGANVPGEYGMLYSGGVVSDAWTAVTSLSDTNLAKLARAVMHASVFETAFHDEDNNDVSRYSTGDYIYPDSSSDNIADFAKYAQSQSRMAAIYERVDDWAASPASTPTTGAEDVDLDGEDEYLLYSDRLFALFERIGGRLVGVWVRDILSGDVYQAAGNMISYSGSETEDEGSYSVETNGTVVAYRTSLLKDWYATKSGGTVTYNNDLYTFTDQTNGWRIVSSDTNIQKTVTLSSGTLDVEYQLLNGMAGETLYVRHGFSPNLYDLLLNGQETLGDLNVSGGVMTLANTNYGETVVTTLGYQDSGHNALLNTNAVDDDPSQGIEFYTLNMRNQAQTHQVEIYGTNTFSFALSFRAYPSDWDGDEMPNSFEDNYGLDAESGTDGNNDDDGDGVVNADEYISNTSPNDGTDYLQAASIQATNGAGIIVRFPTELVREYFISYTDGSLISPTWQSVNTNGLDGTGGVYQWLDDGALTAPHPFSATNRNYRIGVALPQ